MSAESEDIHAQKSVCGDLACRCTVMDINTFIHNVTYTYHPEVTEPIPPTNYSIPPEQQSTSSTPFSLHQVYMTNPNPLPRTPSLYNVQPTSHSSQPRLFPSLPYSPENLKFINSLALQILNMLHFVICYSNIRPAMLPIKTMLARLQLLFVSDSNQMLK